MGGAQSAQREDKKDSAAEESGKVEDAQTEQGAEDKPLKNNGQLSDISGKDEDTVVEVNRRCEDEIAAEAIVSPGENVSEAKKPLEEETALENVGINENESPYEADANKDDTLETIEMDAKHNDINDSFKRFFSNINLKVTVKRGSTEKDDIAANVPDDTTDDTTEEEPNRPEGIDDTAKENESENAENNTSLNTAQDTYGHDTTSPALTDITSEEVLEKTEEKIAETKEDVTSENADPTTTAPVGDDESAQQNLTSEEEMVVSPVKRFFKTGIFSGLRKKKKSVDETAEKEFIDIRKVEDTETTEQHVEQEQNKNKEADVGTETVTVQTEQKENELQEEILSAACAQTTDEGKSTSTDPSTVIVNEPEIISSQEKDKVPASPLKRLLSGSSFRKSVKKQRERKSSETKLSDSGEHVSNQVPPSTDTTENQKAESLVVEEDGAWASFKKLMTPKKRIKRSSLTNEETQTPSSVQESKSSEGEQMSDNSTEESKKRKDSSVSWEAVLCGSGRRRSRSRKTSDSEDEKPQEESDNRKPDSPLESSSEVDKTLTSHPKQEGSASEGEGGSTWKSFKKLVTPKRKAKDEDIQSDGEVTQEDSSFLIKKLLPVQKKRKPTERQDYASSDEADKEITSDDEDSETPAVVPISEFDTVETGVHLQTHADIESHLPIEADIELQEHLDNMPEPGPLGDSLQSEAITVEDNEGALKDEASTTPISNQEPDELTELISKHQQLSDIPEEGIITETMVTPSSVAEQPARDDTIAEDLIEITSEAITAPEPIDATLADDTEMISAVSQLSDSSKTSGNTTPVPAEYTVMDTEVLLQQVAENMSLSPKADPLCLDEISSERLVASVSFQILETFVKQQPTVLQIHKRSDATSFKTGLNVKELDAIDKLAATAQTERIEEFNEAVSTEIVSEVPTELDAAESGVDAIYKASVTRAEETIQELESINMSQSEYEDASTGIRSEQEEVESYLVEAFQAKMETLEADIQEEETEEVNVDQEVQTLLETEDEIKQKVTGQRQDEHQDQSSIVVQELQAVAAVESDTLKSEKDIVHSPENKAAEDISAVETVMVEPKDVEPEKENKLQEDKVPDVLDSQRSGLQIYEKEVLLSEDIPPAEAATDEPKGPTEPLSEVHIIPEKEVELQRDAAKTEHQLPEALAVPEATPDSEIVTTQTLDGKVPILESSSRVEPEVEPFTEVDVEPEAKEQPADAGKPEDGQAPEVLDVQDTTVDLQMSSIQIPTKEVLLSEDIKPEEEVRDEGQPDPVAEFKVELEKTDKLQKDSAKAEHGQVSEIIVVQESDLESVTENMEVQLSEDTLPAETITDEPKVQPVHPEQVNVEQEKENEPEADAAITEQLPEILEEEAPALISEIGSIQMPEKVLLSEDIKQREALADEPKEKTEPVNDVHVETEKKDELQTDSDKAEHSQVLVLQESDLESHIQAVESKVPVSNDTTPAETITEKPEGQPESLTQVNVEQEKEDKPEADSAKTEQLLEIILEKQENALISQIGSIQMPEQKVTLLEDSKPDDTKDKTEPLNEVDVKPENENQLQAGDTKSDKAVTDQPENVTELRAKVHVDMKSQKEVTDKPKEESEPITKASVETEEKELQVDAAKTEQVSETLVEEQATELISQIDSLPMPEKEVTLSEDIKPEEVVSEEHKEKTKFINGIHDETVKTHELQTTKSEHEQDPNLSDVQEAALVSVLESVETAGCEVPLKDEILPEEAIIHQPEEEKEPHTEVDVEPENEDKLPEGEAKAEKAATDQTEIEKVHVEPEKEDELQAEDMKSQKEDTDKPKEESEPVTEVSVEIEKELQADAARTEQVSETLVEEQATELISQIDSFLMPEKEVTLSEDIKPEEVVSEEHKEKTELGNEVHVETKQKDELQAETTKSEQDPDLSDVQEVALVSVLDSVETAGCEVPLKDEILPEEAIIHQPEEEKEPHTEVDVEPENEDKLPEGDAKAEKAATDQTEIEKVHVEPEKEDKLQAEDVKSQKEDTDKPKEESEPVTEVSVETKKKEADAAKTEQVVEDVPTAEMVTDEPEVQPKDLTELEQKVQGDAAETEQIQVSETSGAVPEVALDLQSYSVETEPEKAVKEEVKEELEPITEVTSGKPQKEDELNEDGVNTEHSQVSEILEEHATALVSQIGNIQMPEKSTTLSEDIQPKKAIRDEIKEHSEPVSKVMSVEPQKEDELHIDAVNTEHGQIEILEQATALVSQMGNIIMPEKNTTLSEDIQPEKAVKDAIQVSETIGAVKLVALDLQTDSAEAEPEKAVKEEVKEESECVTEVTSVEPEKEDELHEDAVITEHGQVSEILEEQATALVSQIGNIQMPEKKTTLSEDIQPKKAIRDGIKEHSEPVSKVMSVEPQKEDELHTDAVNTEHGQVSEILEEQATALVSQMGNIIMPEKNTTLSEDIQPEKAVKDAIEASETIGAVQGVALDLQTDSVEAETEKALTDELTNEITEVTNVKEDELHEDVKTENGQEAVVPEAATDSEIVTIQTSEKKEQILDIPPTETVSRETTEHHPESTETKEWEINEPLLIDTPVMDGYHTILIKDTPETETVTDKTKEETEPLAEVKCEPMDTSKTELQEPEQLEAVQVAKLILEVVSLKPEVKSEEMPKGTVEDEPIQGTEGYIEPKEDQPARDAEYVQVSEVLPCDVKDIVTESEKKVSVPGNMKESVDDVIAQEAETRLLPEDNHSQDADSVIALATDETENEAVKDTNQDLETHKDQTTEVIAEDVHVQQEDRSPEVVDKLQTLSAVRVSSITKEDNRAHILNKVISEKTPAPTLDNGTVTDEPKYAVYLNEVQGQAAREKEIKFHGPETKTSTVEHAVVAHVILCNLKEVSTAIPDVLIEKPSNVHEPMIDLKASEFEFRKEAEIATQFVTNDVTGTATESSVVVMMHAPSAESEKNHSIQVQVVDVDIKSAEMQVDSALEVGVTEAKEVIDVCHETIKAIDQLSATEETVEELITEENKIINHQVIQHVKASLPETVGFQTSTQDKQEQKEQPDVTEVSKSDDVEDGRATEKQDDVLQTPSIVIGLPLSIYDLKDNLEEHATKLKQSDAGVTVKEIRSEELEMKKMNREAQTTKSSQSQTVPVSNTGLEVLQNTGVISSIGNMESPSSLSLELKLNIQFGQAKIPASPSLATEKTEPMKQTKISDAGIQAIDPQDNMNGAHENQKKPEMHDVTVQASEITEPECVNLGSTDRAVIRRRPVLLDFGIQPVEAAQPVEQIKSTETLTPSVKETEKIKAVRKAESFLSQPVLYEACYEEIRVEDPVQQIEEENDQDLWVDAEEEIPIQEESGESLVKMEKPVASQVERNKEKAELDYKFEMAPETTPKSKKTKEEEQEMHKMAEICETENEAEEFAVALEHPVTATNTTTE